MLTFYEYTYLYEHQNFIPPVETKCFLWVNNSLNFPKWSQIHGYNDLNGSGRIRRNFFHVVNGKQHEFDELEDKSR